MQKYLEVHEDDLTISVHKDRMNPSEIIELIAELQGNLMVIMKSKSSQDPIDIMINSVRLNRHDKKISFKLSWGMPVIEFGINDEIPKPTIYLTNEQKVRYYNNLSAMIKAI